MTDKVAIITGGGGGIGKGIAQAFAAFGAKVVVVDNHEGRATETVAEIEKAGGRAIASVVDVQERDQVAALAKTAFSAFGKVDILVNNVGGFIYPISRVGSPPKPENDFLDLDEEEWDALYNINFRHVLLCTKEFLPSMIDRGQGGCIINVATVECFRAIPPRPVYSAYNGAVAQFTKSLAVEMAQHRIRINCIAPDTTGSIALPLNRHPEWDRPKIPIWYPLGRFGLPEDHAGAAIFLASDLSQWVTGTIVHVDGGTYAAGGWYRKSNGRWTNRPLRP